MSTCTLEEKRVAIDLMKKRSETEALSNGFQESILMTPSEDTLALLRERPEFQAAAKDLITLLMNEDWVKKVSFEAFSDPDSEDEPELSVDIEAKISGSEARKKLDDIVKFRMPESARHIEDELIFCVVEPNAA